MSLSLDHLPSWPDTDFSAFGEVEIRKIGKIQKLIGAFLGRNWVAIPHVTHQDEADITELEAQRSAYNARGDTKLTIVPILVKVLAEALRQFPQFNASLNAQVSELVLKKYVHVGVAVDTPGGLLVPVIRDCDAKSFEEIALELQAVSEKARSKGLPLSVMSGGCITLTSLGHIGGTGFTPIVNAPEVAILGVTRSRIEAAPGEDGGVVWRRKLPLSLSYDHRVINGADAARFTRFIADRLADPALIV
jgi:pyruvate dehydrogenase E2 component (dihydrolipoamide acetyltransferase)